MEDEKMPLAEHLGEFRKRIITSLIAVAASFAVAFAYSQKLFEILMFPLRYSLDFSVKNRYIYFVPHDKLQDAKLVFLAPAEAFWMNLKVAFVAGLIASLPVIFHQVWKFISPGLLPKEKKYALPFIVAATGLFISGALFCYLIILPFALQFLLTYKVGDILMPMLSVGQYIDFCLKFILAFGIVFELPVVIIFLVKLGVVTPGTLANNRKYAVLIAFVIAAILTPTPDAFNQTLMVVPILLLYEAGICVSSLFMRKKEIIATN